MMNAVFREWEFEIMEEYLYRQEHSPIDHFYKERFTPSLAWRSLYPHANFIIVYLEDFKKGTDGKYQLLMDFFTFSDFPSASVPSSPGYNTPDSPPVASALAESCSTPDF